MINSRRQDKPFCESFPHLMITMALLFFWSLEYGMAQFVSHREYVREHWLDLTIGAANILLILSCPTYCELRWVTIFSFQVCLSLRHVSSLYPFSLCLLLVISLAARWGRPKRCIPTFHSTKIRSPFKGIKTLLILSQRCIWWDNLSLHPL